jgi:hypothetical protein
MRVVATKGHPNPVAGVDQVWGPEGLSHLLAEADYVVMCAALTEETRGMIGEAELRQMKATAYFVNIARGALVLEGSLLRALRERWIACACAPANSILTASISRGRTTRQTRKIKRFITPLLFECRKSKRTHAVNCKCVASFPLACPETGVRREQK